MTYRERKEARLARRMEWAEQRDQQAAAGFARASAIAENIPFGQPILVGHHSEAHARRDIARIDAGMRAGCESQDMAAKHRSVADGIEQQLDRSVYSDDANAVEALETRIAQHIAQRDRMKMVNKLYKKQDAAGLASLGLSLETLTRAVARQSEEGRLSWLTMPHPAYELSNLGARIRTDQKRAEQIKAQRDRAEAASQAGGVLVERFNGQTPNEWCRITFPEKPDREIIDALKAAGFRWGAGSWVGKTEQLPAIMEG